MIQQEEDSTSIIVGSVVGVLLALVVLVVVLAVFLRRMEVTLSKRAVSQFIIPSTHPSVRERAVEEGKSKFNCTPLRRFK